MGYCSMERPLRLNSPIRTMQDRNDDSDDGPADEKVLPWPISSPLLGLTLRRRRASSRGSLARRALRVFALTCTPGFTFAVLPR